MQNNGLDKFNNGLSSSQENAMNNSVDAELTPLDSKRRDTIKVLLGASAALSIGGTTGCARKPKRKIISQISGPEYQQPGKNLYYSSAWTEGPFPYGMSIKTIDGRPIKVEGNPENPINKGSSDSAMQAATLSLYDPDRLRAPQAKGKEVSWDAVDKDVIEKLKAAGSVAVVTRSSIGPTERYLVDRLTRNVNNARHFSYESISDAPRRAALSEIYKTDGELVHHYDKADLIVSFDCDFLSSDGNALENVRKFAQGRALDDSKHKNAKQTRFYAVESTMTVSSANVDNRTSLKPSQMTAAINALRAALKGNTSAVSAFCAKYHANEKFFKAVLKDLKANKGKTIVVAGAHLPKSAHAATALLNDALEAESLIWWNPKPATLPVSSTKDMEDYFNKGVDVALFVGVNPAYDWAGGSFDSLMSKVKFSVVHTLLPTETSSKATYALPSAHNFESWNDREPANGLSIICQPVIHPIYKSRMEGESLLAWTKGLVGAADELASHKDYYSLLKGQWKRLSLYTPATDGLPQEDERGWESVLSFGGKFQASYESLPIIDTATAEALAAKEGKSGKYEVVIFPHNTLYDGRFSNNGWLQEMPDPVTKQVWGNGAIISPKTAEALGVKEGDHLSIAVGSGSATVPAVIERGTAEGVIKVTLGHGRTAGGETAKLAEGTNVAPLINKGETPRYSEALVKKASGHTAVVRTQKEFSQHGRPIVLEGSLDEYRKKADFVNDQLHFPPDAELYDQYEYNGHKWVMAIDLNTCVGCTDCMTACQAENNVAIVGRDECSNGREMHWLRMDRYLDDDPDNPTVASQPMLCMHCDQAPCENVCPINATAHSDEGLNDMAYNRCVGTRYCANNCPYKVRRFNYLRYQAEQLKDPIQELVFNPQVTVRGVGVMEKCTFCVQRINEGKFKAANKKRPLRDGEIKTACQQACAAGSISFGDINNPKSRVSKLANSARSYRVLQELNIRPNVNYLARVRNPSPDLKTKRKKEAHG